MSLAEFCDRKIRNEKKIMEKKNMGFAIPIDLKRPHTQQTPGP